MTSSPYGPYKLGYTRATMINTKGNTTKTLCKSLKFIVFGLQAAIRLHEGGITSNRKSARCGELCTQTLHTPPVTCWKQILFEIFFNAYILKLFVFYIFA